jgi:hypothetical protein
VPLRSPRLTWRCSGRARVAAVIEAACYLDAMALHQAYVRELLQRSCCVRASPNWLRNGARSTDTSCKQADRPQAPLSPVYPTRYRGPGDAPASGQ